MQSRYRVCVPLKSSERAIERLAALCGRWRGVPGPDAAKLETGHHWEGPFQSVESKLVEIPGGFAWGFRHRIHDPQDAGLTWITDVGLSLETGSAWLSVGNHIATSEHVPARPIVRPRTRPRIVPDAIREFGCPLPIGPQARILEPDSNSIRAFLCELYDPQRHYPLLFVSCRNDSDRPVIDPNALADWLAGTASVVVACNRFPSLRLAEYLPPALNCWDGAVRLYWPAFNSMDPSHLHRVWRHDVVRELDDVRDGGAGFKNFVLGQICDQLSHRRHRGFVDWSTLERLAAEQEIRVAMERATADANQGELVKLFEADNVRLAGELVNVANERDGLQDAVDRLVVERDYWRDQARAAAAGEQTDDATQPEPRSVAEAVERAEREFASQLIFALNSKSDRDTAYGWPSEVARALQWLATTYRDAKLGIRRCPDLDQSLKDGCDASWFWKGGQSEITVSTYANWYECAYGGQKHEVLEHVGTGKSKRPEETIRIAFKWLEAEEKVLIGFIGQHQRTATT